VVNFLGKKPFSKGFSGDGEVSRGENMLYCETDQESYITEHTLVYRLVRIESNMATIYSLPGIHGDTKIRPGI